MELLMLVLNIIGTAAFSISGALTAIKREMDLLGVIILGTITAIGGGIIRDLIIGQIPPDAFVDPLYTLIGCVSAILVFVYVYFRTDGYNSILASTFQKVVLAADTVGLSLFTVVGVQVAFEHNEGSNFFLSVFLGTITGVGGGLLRDVFVNDKPYIFYKHIYACASIAGAIVCTFLWDLTGEKPAMLAGASVVIIIRVLAIHYGWNLPRIHSKGIS